MQNCVCGCTDILAYFNFNNLFPGCVEGGREAIESVPLCLPRRLTLPPHQQVPYPFVYLAVSLFPLINRYRTPLSTSPSPSSPSSTGTVPLCLPRRLPLPPHQQVPYPFVYLAVSLFPLINRYRTPLSTSPSYSSPSSTCTVPLCLPLRLSLPPHQHVPYPFVYLSVSLFPLINRYRTPLSTSPSHSSPSSTGTVPLCLPLRLSLPPHQQVPYPFVYLSVSLFPLINRYRTPLSTSPSHSSPSSTGTVPLCLPLRLSLPPHQQVPYPFVYLSVSLFPLINMYRTPLSTSPSLSSPSSTGTVPLCLPLRLTLPPHQHVPYPFVYLSVSLFPLINRYRTPLSTSPSLSSPSSTGTVPLCLPLRLSLPPHQQVPYPFVYLSVSLFPLINRYRTPLSTSPSLSSPSSTGTVPLCLPLRLTLLPSSTGTVPLCLPLRLTLPPHQHVPYPFVYLSVSLFPLINMYRTPLSTSPSHPSPSSTGTVPLCLPLRLTLVPLINRYRTPLSTSPSHPSPSSTGTVPLCLPLRLTLPPHQQVPYPFVYLSVSLFPLINRYRTPLSTSPSHLFPLINRYRTPLSTSPSHPSPSSTGTVPLCLPLRLTLPPHQQVPYPFVYLSVSLFPLINRYRTVPLCLPLRLSLPPHQQVPYPFVYLSVSLFPLINRYRTPLSTSPSLSSPSSTGTVPLCLPLRLTLPPHQQVPYPFVYLSVSLFPLINRYRTPLSTSPSLSSPSSTGTVPLCLPLRLTRPPHQQVPSLLFPLINRYRTPLSTSPSLSSPSSTGTVPLCLPLRLTLPPHQQVPYPFVYLSVSLFPLINMYRTPLSTSPSHSSPSSTGTVPLCLPLRLTLPPHQQVPYPFVYLSVSLFPLINRYRTPLSTSPSHSSPSSACTVPLCLPLRLSLPPHQHVPYPFVYLSVSLFPLINRYRTPLSTSPSHSSPSSTGTVPLCLPLRLSLPPHQQVPYPRVTKYHLP